MLKSLSQLHAFVQSNGNKETVLKGLIVSLHIHIQKSMPNILHLSSSQCGGKVHRPWDVFLFICLSVLYVEACHVGLVVNLHALLRVSSALSDAGFWIPKCCGWENTLHKACLLYRNSYPTILDKISGYRHSGGGTSTQWLKNVRLQDLILVFSV